MSDLEKPTGHAEVETSEKVAASPPLGDSQELESTYGISEKSLLRKLDFHLLPALTLLYLLSFLDRSNVANARLEGLTTDLHMTGNQYLTGLTLYFIGYVLFEVPCNIVLKLTSPRLWLPTLTLAWGVVATLLGVTQNMAGFFVARFFLGVTESGLFPGVVFYLSMWYRREEQHYRISLFFSAASLAGAFGGVLAWVRLEPQKKYYQADHILGYRTYERGGRFGRMEMDLHSRRHLNSLSLLPSILLHCELPCNSNFLE